MDKFSILEDFVKTNKKELVPDLLVNSLSDKELKEKFIEYIVILFETYNGKDIMYLYDIIRRKSSLEWNCNYYSDEISIEYILDGNMNFDEKIVYLGLFFHPSGYIREKVIKKLVEYKSSKIMPFILLRVSDWVPWISDFVYSYLMSYLNEDNILEVLDNIGIVNKIKSDADYICSYNQRYDLTNKKLKIEKVIEKLNYYCINYNMYDKLTERLKSNDRAVVIKTFVITAIT